MSASNNVVLTLNLGLEGIGIFVLLAESGENTVGLENTRPLSGIVRHGLFWFLLQIPGEFTDKFTEEVRATVLTKINFLYVYFCGKSKKFSPELVKHKPITKL